MLRHTSCTCAERKPKGTQALEQQRLGNRLPLQGSQFDVERVGHHPTTGSLQGIVIDRSCLGQAPGRLGNVCRHRWIQLGEACANFAKAKELGDQVVDSLIEKYCK